MRAPLLLAALLALGCGREFAPETVVETLRVLGMRATPAELHPGQTAALEALVVDPSRPGQRSTVLWVGCDPDPFNLGRSACSDTAVLDDPTALAPSPGQAATLPPGMHVIGFNEAAAYTAPAELFAQLSPEDPRRRAGAIAQVLAVAVAEEVALNASPEVLAELLERVKRKEVASLVSLFRVRVSEQVEENRNPAVGSLLIDGARLPEGAAVRIAPAHEAQVQVELPEGELETYVQPTAAGEVEKTESVVVAFYSTFGRWSPSRLAVSSTAPLLFTGPGTNDEPLPERRSGSVWEVLRDTRGGQSWNQRPLYLCDTALPAPSASAVHASGSLLTIEGIQLGSVLEVWLGSQVLREGAFSPARGVYEAKLPTLTPGDYPVLLRGKDCADVETGLIYRAP